eukprot:COSAG01_NODE_32808_length_575_cov_0.651261_1_plen_67_part_10
MEVAWAAAAAVVVVALAGLVSACIAYNSGMDECLCNARGTVRTIWLADSDAAEPAPTAISKATPTVR